MIAYSTSPCQGLYALLRSTSCDLQGWDGCNYGHLHASLTRPRLGNATHHGLALSFEGKKLLTSPPAARGALQSCYPPLHLRSHCSMRTTYVRHSIELLCESMLLLQLVALVTVHSTIFLNVCLLPGRSCLTRRAPPFSCSSLLDALCVNLASC